MARASTLRTYHSCGQAGQRAAAVRGVPEALDLDVHRVAERHEQIVVRRALRGAAVLEVAPRREVAARAAGEHEGYAVVRVDLAVGELVVPEDHAVVEER